MTRRPSKSPLRDRPLRHAGQSLDEEIERFIDDQAMAPYAGIAALWAAALFETIGALLSMPRRPLLLLSLALAGTVWFAYRLARTRRRVRDLRQGRDGERTVGRLLETLRQDGADVLHDIPADHFNVDHVVVCRRGVFVIETKTPSKPMPGAKIAYDGEAISIAGRPKDASAIKQAAAEAAWIAELLQKSTGRPFPVRGVVVYPGWWIDQTHKERPRTVWALSHKALPAWIRNEPEQLSQADASMAAFHLSRYVQSKVDAS
jgi:hypothetical protein